MLTFFKTLLAALAGALVARPAGALVSGNLLLYTNSPGVNENTVLGDLTEPTYPGYLRQAVTVTGPYSTGGSGPYTVHVTDTTWQMSDATVPTTIVGAAVVDGSGNLLFGGPLPNPYHLATATDALILGGTMSLDDAGLGGTWDVES